MQAAWEKEAKRPLWGGSGWLNATYRLLSLREPFGARPANERPAWVSRQSRDPAVFTPEGGGVLVSRGQACIEVRQKRVENTRPRLAHGTCQEAVGLGELPDCAACQARRAAYRQQRFSTSMPLPDFLIESLPAGLAIGTGSLLGPGARIGAGSPS
jgi:hypothetical protein